MADNSANLQSKYDLDMTGRPVLIQNELGVFYGVLEKADTRSGTALLRDGFMVSPDRHITFVQYLDFLNYEAEKRRDALESATGQTTKQQSKIVYQDSTMPRPDDILIPNQISINEPTFLEHVKPLTITDYATDGIALVQRSTSTHENTNYRQETTELLSLTNILCIVPVSSLRIVHEFHELIEGIKTEKDKESSYKLLKGLLEFDITPRFTFKMLNSYSLRMDISRIGQYLKEKTENQIMEDFVRKEMGIDFDTQYTSYKSWTEYEQREHAELLKPMSRKKYEEFKKALANIDPASLEGIGVDFDPNESYDAYIKKNSDYDNEHQEEPAEPMNIEQYKKFLVDTWDWVATKGVLPKLVVNTNERIELYKKLKKAQDDEQVK